MDDARSLYSDPRFIAAIPAVAVVWDYILTLSLADSREMILAYEASPLVKLAVSHNLMFLYLPCIAAFYFIASYSVLKVLKTPDLYSVGVALIGTVSLTHLLGGLSWYFRDPVYSNTVFFLSLLSILMALILFGFAVRGSGSGSPGG